VDRDISSLKLKAMAAIFARQFEQQLTRKAAVPS
jgi:hypothetical protein